MLRRPGDRGEGASSYLAVILLIAAVTATVTAVALPDQVLAKIRAGICLVAGGEDCADGGRADPDASPSPSGSPGTSPSPSPSVSQTESAQERELREAREALAEAEQEADAAQEAWDEFDLLAEIAELGLDFIAGDIIACVEDPNLLDCLWALVSVVPWSKLGKLVKSIPDVARLLERFLDLKDRLNSTRRARDDAQERVEDALEACRNKRNNSFVPGTPVLMADGSQKAIERVRVGDLVRATDPRTGRGGPQHVTAVIGGTGIKRLVDITVDLDGRFGGRTSVVTATANHPFWVNGTGDWIEAGELVFGDLLSTVRGRPAMVVAARERTVRQRVHNLSVTGPHTYHVVTGGRGVLVHNDPVDEGPVDDCTPDRREPSPAPTKGQQDPASQEGNVGLVADKIAAHADHRSIPGVEDADVAGYLENIMQASPGYKLRPSPSGTPRWAWWDAETGTMVIRKGNEGTFMQPDRGYQYFLEQVS